MAWRNGSRFGPDGKPHRRKGGVCIFCDTEVPDVEETCSACRERMRLEGEHW